MKDIETVPGRKAETDSVCYGISEGFHLAQSGRAVAGGAGAKGSAPLGSDLFH